MIFKFKEVAADTSKSRDMKVRGEFIEAISHGPSQFGGRELILTVHGNEHAFPADDDNIKESDRWEQWIHENAIVLA